MPLHRRRYRERGFNQAEAISACARPRLEKVLGLRLRMETSALLRRHATDTQVGLTLKQRQEQMRGAFAVVMPERVKGREILLADDVLTTGATTSECARVLGRAGASGVWVLTVARAMRIEAGMGLSAETPGASPLQ